MELIEIVKINNFGNHEIRRYEIECALFVVGCIDSETALELVKSLVHIL